jgi:hypothetical protein
MKGKSQRLYQSLYLIYHDKLISGSHLSAGDFSYPDY